MTIHRIVRRFTAETQRTRSMILCLVVLHSAFSCFIARKQVARGIGQRGSTTRHYQALPSTTKAHGLSLRPLRVRGEKAPSAGKKTSLPLSTGKEVTIAWIRGALAPLPASLAFPYQPRRTDLKGPGFWSKRYHTGPSPSSHKLRVLNNYSNRHRPGCRPAGVRDDPGYGVW